MTVFRHESSTATHLHGLLKLFVLSSIRIIRYAILRLTEYWVLYNTSITSEQI